MSTLRDGGMAFPDPVRGAAHSTQSEPERGLSVRDYFAAQALVSLTTADVDRLVAPGEPESTELHRDQYVVPASVAVTRRARACWLVADAVLAERERPTAIASIAVLEAERDAALARAERAEAALAEATSQADRAIDIAKDAIAVAKDGGPR